MPLVVFKHTKDVLSHEQIRKLGELVRPVVAQYCSINGMLLTQDDIDWEPVERHPSAIAPPFAVEIETYDFADRIEQLTRERTEALKAEIAVILQLHFHFVPQDRPWLWMKYVDQRGHHV